MHISGTLDLKDIPWDDSYLIAVKNHQNRTIVRMKVYFGLIELIFTGVTFATFLLQPNSESGGKVENGYPIIEETHLKTILRLPCIEETRQLLEIHFREVTIIELPKQQTDIYGQWKGDELLNW